MHRLGWTLRIVLAGCLALSSCSGGDDDATPATVPRASSTTTTSIDVSTVPDTITVEYVQAVMDELDRLLGDAIRELVAAGEPSDKFVAMLKAVYDEPEYGRAESLYGEDAASGLTEYKRPPGNPTSNVIELVDSSERCAVVKADVSFIGVLNNAGEPVPSVIQLLLKDASRDPGGLNPTAWRIVAASTARSTEIPEDPCK